MANEVSHPVWVCGLKHNLIVVIESSSRSHPVWVCGLKHKTIALCEGWLSHTLYGCVD